MMVDTKRTGHGRRIFGRFLASANVLLYGAWGALSLWYQLPVSRLALWWVIGGWLLLSLMMGVCIARWRRPVARTLLVVYLLAAFGLAAWRETLAP